jgi:hypothetical protein
MLLDFTLYQASAIALLFVWTGFVRMLDGRRRDDYQHDGSVAQITAMVYR